jgi:hypothetical protein
MATNARRQESVAAAVDLEFFQDAESWGDDPSHGDRHFIYALIDPRDGLVRYIGVTIDPIMRYETHRCSPLPSIARWIDELRFLGLVPRMVTLTDLYGYQAALRLEDIYIDQYQRHQGGLLNQQFTIAGRRRYEYDQEAHRKVRDMLREARRETNFYSNVALKRHRRGTKRPLAF